MKPRVSLSASRRPEMAATATKSSVLQTLKSVDPKNPLANKTARTLVYVLFCMEFSIIAGVIVYGESFQSLKIFTNFFYWAVMGAAAIVFGINWVFSQDTIITFKGIAKTAIIPLIFLGVLKEFSIPYTIPTIKEWRLEKERIELAEKKQAELEKRLREEELRKRQERNKLATAMDNGTIFEFEVRPDDKKPYEIKKPAIKKGQRFAFLTYTGAIWYRVKDDEKSCFAQVDGNTPYYAYVSGPLEVKSGNAPAKVTLLVYDYK